MKNKSSFRLLALVGVLALLLPLTFSPASSAHGQSALPATTGVAGPLGQPASLGAALPIGTPHPPANNVEFVGQIGGAVTAVAIQGTLAYVGVGPRVAILDLSEPSQPVLVGQTDSLPGLVQGLAVAGSHAYVADQYAGLRIIDVSDSAAPFEAGACDTPGDARGVAVSGSFVYIADYGSGLRIIDVSDPAAPFEAGFHDTPGSAYGVAVSGSYAYVADHGSGLSIIDVSDPAAPFEAGFYDTPGWAYGVAASGSYAYVADYFEGLRIIDVSDPAAPFEAGFHDTPGFAYGVAVSGSYAYVADSDGGLRIIDVSDPAVPFEAGFYDTPGTAYGVAVSASYAYIVDYSEVVIIDVSDPEAPFEAGFYGTPGSAYGVAVSGSYAYVTASDGGLSIIDVSDPSVPFEAGFHDTPGYARGVAVSGSYAYVADSDAGLRIIDVSDPAVPFEAGFNDTPGSAYGVAVSGGYAYVADYSGGLRIIDVSDPAAPFEAGFYDTPDWANGVAVSGSYAYVADYSSGLRIIDVSDPAAPFEAGFYDTSALAYGVAVSGSYAYVADYSEVVIIDVSDPAAPFEAGFHNTPGLAYGVDVSGSYAYVADYSSGLRIIDVSDPAAPFEAGFYDTPGSALSVAVSASYAYLADWRCGLLILRFTESEPTYAVSGRATDPAGNPIEGVTVYATGGFSAITDAAGDYTLTGLPAGTYVLTPGKAGYGFEPATRTVDVPPDAVNQDFVGALTYSISGQVTDAAGQPFAGVTITASGGHTAVTDAAGEYILDDLLPGTYTLTASKPGFTCDPPTLTVILPPDATGADFAMVPECAVPLSEVTVTSPGVGYVGLPSTFTSTIEPADATEPVTYSWAPEPISGQGTSVATYTFDEPATYTVTLAAENCGGIVTDSAFIVIISAGAGAPVDPETGATLVYTDTQGNETVVQVPPDAITEEIVLVLVPVDSVAPPAGLAFAHHAFDLDAYRDGALLPGFAFEVPVQLTVDYSDADVAGLDEESLEPRAWTGGQWSTDGITITDRDTLNNRLEATVAHLSTFAVFGEAKYRLYMPLVVKSH